jgi:hypothetical protein
MSSVIKIKYFNSFWNKKIVDWENEPTTPPVLKAQWPGLEWNPPGYPTYPNNVNISATYYDSQWMIEESRILGGFNNTSVDFGVKAYANELNINQVHRFNSIIYSGLYNPRTGFNNTNVFSVGEDITKSLDPSYGEIQRTYASDNDLTILQQNKVSRALIDKDALYTAEGGGNVTSTNLVIGQVIPYVGDFGISDNPESFARYGYRRYFADAFRGSVMRLSRDGLTEISEYGMSDYFRDELKKISSEFKTYSVNTNAAECPSPNPNTSIVVEDADDIEIGMSVTLNGLNTSAYVTDVNYSNNQVTFSEALTFTCGSPLDDLLFTKPVKDKVIGGWDIFDKQYVISMQVAKTSPSADDEYETTAFDESVRGWPSRYTYNPKNIFSLKDTYYTTFDGKLWKQHDEVSNNNRGTFYNTYTGSKVEFVVNDGPSVKKVFQTVNYEGDNGYEITSFVSDFQQIDPDLPITSPGNYVNKNSYRDTTTKVKSYDEGRYTDSQGYTFRAGFDRKENLYVANLINNSTQRPDGILFGSQMSGIKAYFATVTIATDASTDVGGLKEIWSVGTKFIQSS